jgi:hypothetical protein
MLRHFGIHARVKRFEPSGKGRRPIYEIRVADVRNADLFAKRIGILSRRKTANLLAARLPGEKTATRGHFIAHAALLEDLARHARGLDAATRSYVAVVRRSGAYNIEWLQRLVHTHPQMRDSKAAHLLIEGIDYGIVQSTAPAPEQEWIIPVTTTGEPVFGNAFAIATSRIIDDDHARLASKMG